MEREHRAPGAVPIEKQLERTRAGEALQILIRCIVDETSALTEHETITRELLLLRPAAKFLLTTCDRLRRHALDSLAEPTPADGAVVLAMVRVWDSVMRQILAQHGVQHPLNELVSPIRVAESELLRVGISCSDLLNGEDLLGL